MSGKNIRALQESGSALKQGVSEHGTCRCIWGRGAFVIWNQSVQT